MKPAISLLRSAPSSSPRAVPPQVTTSDIQEFMPLVRTIAGRMLRKLPPNILRDDLIAAGTYGLHDALLKNGKDRGPKFEWYARRRIQGAILDELRAQDWLTRSARGSVATDSGDGPAPLAGFVAIEDLSELKRSGFREETTPSPLEAAEASSERALLFRAMEQLDPRERTIVTRHYFDDVEFRVIAAQLGVSDPRVSQLHSRAISKLQAALAPPTPAMNAA
jgi:RNA polymerase sigma factor for flagellar operon FliA